MAQVRTFEVRLELKLNMKWLTRKNFLNNFLRNLIGSKNLTFATTKKDLNLILMEWGLFTRDVRWKVHVPFYYESSSFVSNFILMKTVLTIPNWAKKSKVPSQVLTIFHPFVVFFQLTPHGNCDVFYWQSPIEPKIQSSSTSFDNFSPFLSFFRLGRQQTLKFVILISNLLSSMKCSIPSTILCAWLGIFCLFKLCVKTSS